jgi:hypothetical protein
MNAATNRRTTGMVQQTEQLQECCSKQNNYRNAAANRRTTGMLQQTEEYRNAATNRRTTGMLQLFCFSGYWKKTQDQ